MADDNKSGVWEYFVKTTIKDVSHGVCNLCKKSFKCLYGSTSCLRNHLKSAHPFAFEKLVGKDSLKRKMKEKHEDEKKPKQKKIETLLPSGNFLAQDSPRATQITAAIGQMMALDFEPYSMVENRGFQELMRILEPHYQMPSRTTFSRQVIPGMYDKVKRSVKDIIATDFGGPQQLVPAFSFTTDLWTSQALDPYISLTVSYITEQFQLKTLALENRHFPGSHTAERILEALEESMDDWGLNSQVPIFCVHDKGCNIRAAVRMSDWYGVACFAHTLQLAISDAIRGSDSIENMLKKCRNIISHYHHSSAAGGRIDAFLSRNNLKQHEFIMSCSTRWYSEFAMVERLLLMKDAVCADIAVTGDIDNLTKSEWKLAEGFVFVCRSLAEATEDSSGEKHPTRSMVIPMIYAVHELLNGFISSSNSKGPGIILIAFARKLTAAMDKRFPNYKNAVPDCVCTYLDPRFKKLLFDDDTMKLIQQQLEDFAALVIKHQPQTIIPNDSTKSGLWAAIDQLYQKSRNGPNEGETSSSSSVGREMALYNEEPPIARTQCPLKWWADNAKKFKMLPFLARAFLSIPASQSKSERLDSTSGHIVEDCRSRLLTQHVKELTFLHENMIS